MALLHRTVIEWHDLIEDPTDTPTDDGYYICTIQYSDDGFRAVQELYFDSDEKKWFLNDLAGDEIGDDDVWVIAWADGLTPYAPKE